MGTHWFGFVIKMDARKKLLLNLFLDEGLDSNLLAEATQLVATENISILEYQTKNIYYKNETTIEQNSYYYPIPRFQDDQFKEQFRMQRSTFELLIQVVGNAMAGREQLQPIARVSLPEKVLYTLTLLSGKFSFREVGENFAIPKSSGHEIFKWVTAAFGALKPQYVKWPSQTKAYNSGVCNLPGVVGVIDECRIPLKLPVRAANAEHKYHALVLQAVCDAHSKFLDVHIDVPNESHCTLLKSELFERLINMNEPLIPKHKHLVGEMPYPLLLNLMTPYPDYGDLTTCHLLYNRSVHLWNAPIERAFAALLSRFRRLESLDVSSVELGSIVVSATCMLHNFMLDCGEPLEDATLNFETIPENCINKVFREHDLLDWEHTAAAEKKRDSLIASFMHNQ